MPRKMMNLRLTPWEAETLQEMDKAALAIAQAASSRRP